MTDKKLVFPNLETERLSLRRMTLEDAKAVFQHFTDPQVNEYLVDEEPFTEMEEITGLINYYQDTETKWYNRWGIFRKSDNRFLGTCGFHIWDKRNNSVEIGYDLSPEYWGQGYMTEALTAAIESGFQNMNLNRIQAFVHLENQKSSALLERMGFQREGITREKHYFRGKYYDHFCYSLLRREWKKGQSVK